MRPERSFLVFACLLLSSLPARAAPCDVKQLREGIQAIQGVENPDDPMTRALTLVAGACASALPAPWHSALQSSPSVQVHSRAITLTKGFFGGEPLLAKKACGGKGSLETGFTLPADTGRESLKPVDNPDGRQKVFKTCSLAKRKLFTEDEYVDAIAPEAGLVLYDWLREQRLSHEEARTLARWVAGVEAGGTEIRRGMGVMGRNGKWVPLESSHERVVMKAEIEGASYPLEEVDRVLERNRSQARFCQEKELPRHPTLQGRLVMTFTIGAEGNVSEPAVVETTLKEGDVAECMRGRVKTWRFARPAQGAPVKVRASWTFTVPEE